VSGQTRLPQTLISTRAALLSRATASLSHFFGFAKVVTSLSPALRENRTIRFAGK
jgi:hypothetical protein